MKFGELIKDLRQNRDLTQREVAENVEISRSVLSQYENNFVEPTAYVVKRFAEFFDVSADYLLGLEDDFGARTATNAAPMGDSATTSEELRLLKVFRTLSPDLKNTLWSLLDTWTPTETLLPPKKKQT